MSGNLWFKSGLDNTQLKRDTEQAKTHIKGLSEQVQSESKKMDSSFSGIGAGMAAIGGTATIGMLGKQILDTTAKFEKFGIVLKNTLGDVQGQAALDMLSQFAATTPFQLDEVTGSFIKMANQGFVPTREEMVKLGDVASSTGKSFDQLTEALLDAQTGQFERLKEFGIKASAQGDKVTFSFKEQQTTVDNTNSAIQKYILSLGELKGVQGANALISASLTGQISNLEDKLAFMYNSIGKSNSGLLYEIVGAGTAIIDNYETVGKILFGLVATYGTYKTAILLTNAASTVQNVIGIYDIATKELQVGATIKATFAQTALNKAIMANPWAFALAGVVAVISAIAIYASSIKKVSAEQKMLEETTKSVNSQVATETINLDALGKRLLETEPKSRERIKLVKELNEKYPELLAGIDAESASVATLSSRIQDYIGKMTDNIRLKVLYSKITEKINELEGEKDYTKRTELNNELEALKKQFEYQQLVVQYGEENAKLVSRKGEIEKSIVNSQITQATYTYNAFEKIWKSQNERKGILFANAKAEQDALNNAYSEYKNTQSKFNEDNNTNKADLAKIKKIENGESIDGGEKTPSETPAQKKARLAQELKEYQENQSALKAYQDKLLSDKEKSDKAEYERMKSIITDKKDLIDLDLEQTLEGIDREEAALRAKFEKKDKKGNLITIKDENGKPVVFDNSPFEAQRKTANSKAHSDKLAVDTDDAKVLKEQLDSMLKEYQSFEEKRKALNLKYDKERKILVESKNKPGANVQQIDSAIAVADQYNAEDNQALDKAIAEKEISFKGFVDRITKMGLEELLKALEGANNAMQASGATDEEKAILRAKIKALEEQIKSVKTNGGKDTEADVITNAGLTKSKETLGVLQGVNSEIGSIINSFDGLDEGTKTALNAASNIAGAVISSIIGVISLSVVGAEAIKGVERASVILAIIGAAISVITIIIGLFASAAKKRKQEEEAEIERQKQSYLGLIDYNEELRKKYEWTKKIGEAELLYIARTGAELKKQSSANAKEQADLMASLQKQTYTSGTEKDYNWFGGYKTVDVTSSLAGKTYEQISQLAAQGKLSKEGMDYFNALKKAKEEGDDLAKRQEEYLEQVRETFTGTTSQTITDSIIEGFKAGKRSAADFADTFESLMQGAVIKALSNMTDEKVRKWYEDFAEMSKDGLTPEEKAKLKADWDKLVSETAANAANLESATGVSITDKSATRTATARGIATASQESVDENNGRLTAIQGHTFSISEGMKILQANSSQALKHLQGIETNTARLEAIENGMNSVKQGISDINTKGIFIKV